MSKGQINKPRTLKKTRLTPKKRVCRRLTKSEKSLLKKLRTGYKGHL